MGRPPGSSPHGIIPLGGLEVGRERELPVGALVLPSAEGIYPVNTGKQCSVYAQSVRVRSAKFDVRQTHKVKF